MSLLDNKMSILRYTCFISLSRAGNCDVNSDVIAEVKQLEEASGGGGRHNKDLRPLHNTVA